MMKLLNDSSLNPILITVKVVGLRVSNHIAVFVLTAHDPQPQAARVPPHHCGSV